LFEGLIEDLEEWKQTDAETVSRMPFLHSSYANTQIRAWYTQIRAWYTQIRAWYGVKWMKTAVGAATRKLQTMVKMDGRKGENGWK